MSSPDPVRMGLYEQRNQEAQNYFKTHPNPKRLTDAQMKVVHAAIESLPKDNKEKPLPFGQYPEIK